MAQVTRSQYGQSTRSAGSRDAGKKSSTTHYAYTLQKDAEGNVTGKDYVNNLLIYENEGKFGPVLKLRTLGPVPSGDIFIVRKKSAE